jgi:LysM repeat protein
MTEENKKSVTAVVGYKEDGKVDSVEIVNPPKTNQGFEVTDIVGLTISTVGDTIDGLLKNGGATGLPKNFLTGQFILINIEYTYLNYLQAEKEKNPGFDGRSHAVAVSQTFVSTAIQTYVGAKSGAIAGSKVPISNPYAKIAVTVGGAALGGAISLYAVDKYKFSKDETTFIDKVGNVIKGVWPDKKSGGINREEESKKRTSDVDISVKPFYPNSNPAEPIPKTPEPKPTSSIHPVEKGDNLFKIASKHPGVSVEAIAAANNIKITTRADGTTHAPTLVN